VLENGRKSLHQSIAHKSGGLDTTNKEDESNATAAAVPLTSVGFQKSWPDSSLPLLSYDEDIRKFFPHIEIESLISFHSLLLK
jgi:hypothetical protein